MRSIIYTASWAISLGVALLLTKPLLAQATPTISCHCFTDLSYDASNPGAADPYFLAATQNTFMAAVFNVDKKSIVMMKQRGTSADDLWVVNWVAIKGAVDPETLLEARAKSHSWQNIQTPLSPLQEKYGPRFTQALAANFPTDQLAVAIVDDLLTSYRLLDGGNWIHCEKKVPQTKS